MGNDTILVDEDKIKALDDGGVSLNDVKVTTIEDLEKVTNVLIKSVIAIVQGRL
jgi:aerobic-type carbon monoxide dehydrogenase small subunit (CoxS/CutS family)